MVNPIHPGAGDRFALDLKEVGDMRKSARDKSPEAVRSAARQFEALFMNMMLKSMRDATPQDSLFDSQQTRMMTSMLDQQLSQTMASRGLGLAEVLVRQLSGMIDSQGQNGARQGGLPLPGTVPAAPASAAPVSAPASSQPAHVRAFQERLASYAEEASRTTGIPARFMLGQAALESGWGKHEIRHANGEPSHNLFGIKATSAWKGKVVETATTEYVNGVPQTRVEKFRAYDSYADAFRDYARLLTTNPRYEQVIAHSRDAVSFAQGLQKAGYATDPHYAAKLSRIIIRHLSA